MGVVDATIQKLVNRFTHLGEAGRVLSAKNEQRVRSAANELGAMLDDLDQLSEADRTLNQNISLLQRAIERDFRTTTHYASLDDAFDDVAIVRLWAFTQSEMRTHFDDEQLLQVAYTINDDDTVTFGEPVQVVRRITYEPVQAAMTESGTIEGDTIPLIERGFNADGRGMVKIIQAGWGSSGYYPADVLKRDGAKAFPAGTHMYLDHPTAQEARDLPERSVSKLAGKTLSDARWIENHPHGAGLYAEVEIKPSVRNDLDAIAQDIGTSIMASGTYELGEAEGKKGKIITAITQGDSIDFVTRAGAGGLIVPLLESRRAAHTEESMAGQTELLEQIQRDNQALRQSLTISEARHQLDSALRRHTLNEVTERRVTERVMASVPTLADGTLNRDALRDSIASAIDDELAYIAQVGGGSGIRHAGASQPANVDYGAALNETFKSWGLSDEQVVIAGR